MFDDFNDYNFQNKLKIISYNELSKYNKTLKNDMIKLINSESLEIDLEGNISKKYWNELLDIFPEYQLALVDINIEEYIKWKTKSKNEKEYIYYDPWLRVHMKIKNSKILKIAKHSITIKENVKNALSPIYIDIEKDEGIYYEPNIWIEHEIND